MVEFVAMPFLGATDPPSSPRAAGVPSRRRPASWRPALRPTPPVVRRDRPRRARLAASVAAASASCCIRSTRCRALIVFGLSAFSAFFRSPALDFDFLAGAGAVVVNPLPMSKPPRPPGSSSVLEPAGDQCFLGRRVGGGGQQGAPRSSCAPPPWRPRERRRSAGWRPCAPRKPPAARSPSRRTAAWRGRQPAPRSTRAALERARLRAHAVAVGLRSDLTRFASSPSPAAMSSLASSSRAATKSSSGTP